MLAKKKSAGGAPDWVLTYGDMMSLLLCFFILLAAFADYEKGGGGPAAVAAAMQSIQAALGLPVSKSSILSNATEFNSMVERIKKVIQSQNGRHANDSDERGLRGKTFRLRRIRDGLEVTIGGSVFFQPLTARPTADGVEALRELGAVVKGHRNKLEIVGHAGERPLPADWTNADVMRLSYERAQHVGQELIAMGVDPRAIRLVAAGANEPIPAAAGAPLGSIPRENRRGEIIVRESLIDDYQPQQPAAALPPTAPASQPATTPA